MKRYSKIFLASAALVACFMTVSCHKEKETEETRKYFSGSMTFKLPHYVLAGQEFDITPSGVKRASGDPGDWGYYWTFTPITTERDTTKHEGKSGDGTVHLVVKDTLCTFSATCVAFAEGYYTTSHSQSVTIVDPQKSITGRLYPIDMESVKDSRDGKVYKFVEIGGNCWFTDNLAWNGAGKPFMDSEAMSGVLGRYYTWEEASTACPEGWSLPTSEQWNALAQAAGVENPDKDGSYKKIAGKLMANAYFNDERMWEYWPKVNADNSLLFNALPAGYATVATSDEEADEFTNLYTYAAWWLKDESTADAEQALYRYIYVESPDVYVAHGSKTGLRMPVRCVRAAE